MKEWKVAIVIPIYKTLDKMTYNEQYSLIQANTIFKKRDLYIIHPDSLNISEYNELLSVKEIIGVSIDKSYFKNIKSYNKLCLNKMLYKQFEKYDYILIYQSDAFVFADELDYWCNLEYDYIGAPWFESVNTINKPLKCTGVGNGGFSLRKVQSFLKISSNKWLINFHILLSEFNSRYNNSNHRFLKEILGIYFIIKLIKPYVGYEDEFWGLTVVNFFKWFKVAPYQLAMKFSFEVLPSELYKLNQRSLPFGCHAWEKHDPSFWRPHIFSN